MPCHFSAQVLQGSRKLGTSNRIYPSARRRSQRTFTASIAEVLLNQSAILSSALQLAQASGLAEGHCKFLPKRSALVKHEPKINTSTAPGPGFCLSEARQAVLYIGRSRWLLHAGCQSPWHNR